MHASHFFARGSIPFLTSLFLLALALSLTSTDAQTKRRAEVATIETSDLKDFSKNPPEIQKLIRESLALTRQKLGYQYASADPKKGGMDCSGTVYYLLRKLGIDSIPRSSHTQYMWLRDHGTLIPTKATNLNHPQFANLKPGDLLFWSGTYEIKRKIAVTHVMIYLGELKSGKKVMFGASSGRRYNGKARHGVSIFDFILPRKGAKAKFVGHGPIPDLRESPSPKR